MDEVATELARRLEQGRLLSARDQADPRVEGLRAGRRLRFGFWKSNRQSGWYVESNASKKFPFMMVVVRHLWGDKAVIRRGAMIDVELGDADFDRIWRVEAAPADTARQVLDAELRALLTPFEASLIVEDGKVRLEAPGSKIVVPSADELDAAADVVVATAERMRRVAEQQGGRSRAEREGEVEQLKTLRGALWARATWWERLIITLVALALVAAVCGYLWGTFGGLFG